MTDSIRVQEYHFLQGVISSLLALTVGVIVKNVGGRAEANSVVHSIRQTCFHLMTVREEKNDLVIITKPLRKTIPAVTLWCIDTGFHNGSNCRYGMCNLKYIVNINLLFLPHHQENCVKILSGAKPQKDNKMGFDTLSLPPQSDFVASVCLRV